MKRMITSAIAVCSIVSLAYAGTAAQAVPAGKSAVRRSLLIVGVLVLVVAVAVRVCVHRYYLSTFADMYPRPLWIPEKDAPYIPTPQEVVDRMLELAGVTEDDVVYDLGCGDGRIVVTAAKRFGCRALGFDKNPALVEESLENAKINQVEDLVQISEQDIFTLDLSGADVVTLYLLPRLNERLIPQLEKLKPGSRIVSHQFDMKGVRPEKLVHLTCEEDGRDHQLYLWVTPLKKQ